LADGAARELSATFDVADDLLWQAVAGRLPKVGPLAVSRSGRIGPLVEMAMAVSASPSAYDRVRFDPPVFQRVVNALEKGQISGAGARDRAGVFPLSRYDPAAEQQLVWDQWAKHAENAAVGAGLAKGLVAGLMGALGELQDNVYEHSGRPDTGLVAYATGSRTFEFVVADAGMGMLASMRQNPEFAGLRDSGEALRAAASDGASRFARSTGHGFGIGRLFRALAHDTAELRFRSGDHAMRLWGDAPSLTGHVELAQKARLNGLTISVRCAPGEPGRQR
jgi:hypothetical protein